MPTVVKSSSNVAKLGDLSTYNVNTSATPYDTADSSGSVPNVSLTMVDGVDTDYLIEESLSIEGPAVGKYEGKIVDLSDGSGTARYTLNAETILSRLNSEQRLYPQSLYAASSIYLPLAALDYWSQQCGIFYDDVPGDVLFYQSQFLHQMAFVKGTIKPARGLIYGTTGSNAVQADISGRWGLTFGVKADVVVNLPDPGLSVLVPSSGDPRVAVFSSTVLNAGTGRRSTIMWEFLTPTKRPLAIRLVIDSNVGMWMERIENGTAYSVGNTIVARNGTFRVNLGVSQASGGTTAFTLSVLDTTSNAVIGATSANPPSPFNGTLTLTKITYHSEDGGSGTLQGHRGDTISILPTMPSTIPTEQKSFTAGTKKEMLFSGFSGNVWEKWKEYCSIFQLDTYCQDGVLAVGPRPTTTVFTPAVAGVSKRVNSRDSARFVEVVNQNSKPTIQGSSEVPQVFWKADSVYQIAVGETQEFTVQTDHSILTLSQPVAVSGIDPYPYTQGAGQYVVTGSDGYIVSPTFWRDQGGKITVDTTENEGEIKVTIKGPDYDSPRAPYRISEGDAGRPALYVTGSGIVNKPTVVKVSTGNTKAAKEVGTKLDSLFISSTVLTYDAAARAARRFATPDVQVSANEALDYDKPSNLGVVPSGKLIRSGGNILRIVESSQTPSAVSGTAVQHNTIKLVKESFGPGTIGDMKTFYAGKTIGQTNLKPLKVVK